MSAYESDRNAGEDAAPFISKHRQDLDRLAKDASHLKPMPVPIEKPVENTALQSSEKWWNEINPFTEEQTNLERLQTVLIALFPCWRWMSVYTYKESLYKDIIAGLTVGFMVVPQGMSYAKLAGLPVEYGLYSAFVPVYIYAIYGSSRQLAVGPVALVSLLFSSGLTKMLNKGLVFDPKTVAIQASFLVGVINIAMGLLRLGFVTIFLSHSVISGFISGSSIIIACSQLKYLFGYDTVRSDVIYDILINLFDSISKFNYKTFLLGSGAIAILLAMKSAGNYNPKLKWMKPFGPLTVCIIGIVLVVAGNIQYKDIPIVKTIPKGLPKFTANHWVPLENTSDLLIMVIGIVIIGFMESVSIAKGLAAKHKYEIDPSAELLGLGMSNLFGGMFQAYPVTGSFSRSAVNNDTGAVSGIAGIVTATVVMFVLLFLTPVFEKLPNAMFGAIIIAGVIGLFDYPEAIFLWKVNKFDFTVWMLAFLGSLFLGVEIGLAISVALSLLIVIYESAYPHTAVLGRLPGSAVYRSIKQYPEAETYDGIVMCRIDASLYFANALNAREKIRKYRQKAEDEAAARNSHVKYIVIDLTPVSHIDTSALHIFSDMADNYNSRDQQLCFVNPSTDVFHSMVVSGFADKVGREHFFSCNHDAVNWCLQELDLEAVSAHKNIGNHDVDKDGLGSSDDTEQ